MVDDEKGCVPEHDQRESDAFIEHFSEHEARKESAEFRHTKIDLEKHLGLGCAICLMQNLSALISQGKLPASAGDCKLPSGVVVNPMAWYLRKAGELGLYPKADKPFESHHYAAEWAHWPDVDLHKVNLYAQWQDPYGMYAEGFAVGRAPIASPDDNRTQLILCAEHHRGEGIGIHHVPWPSYSAMFVVKDGVVVLEPLKGHHETLSKHEFGAHINKG